MDQPLAGRGYRVYVGPVDSRGRGWLPLVIIVLFGLAPATAHAQARTFGANLARPANNTFATCFNGYDEGPFSPYHFMPRQNSCTWVSVGQLGTSAESHVAPVTGVITNVRIKVGNTTGPMQFVLLRYYRRDNPSDPGHPDLRGPFWQGQSAVFTPTPGAITAVPVNLPVRSDFDATLNAYVFDALGLSVLAPNVPIPANDTGDRSGSFLASAWFPRVSPADQANGRVDGHPPAGVVPLYNATLACGAAIARAHAAQCGGGGPGQLVPSMGLARSTATLRGRIARLRLTCKLSVTCKGRVLLRPRAAGAKKKRKPKTYASASFKIGAGATKTVKVKLTKAGRRLMKNRKKARLQVVTKIGKGKAAKVFSAKLTLKRPS
jgi:hypothetical protein